MEIEGEVRNGIVLLKGGPALPDGTRVVVSVCSAPARRQTRQVKLPLVPSKNRDQLTLNNDTIAEYLNDQEISR